MKNITNKNRAIGFNPVLELIKYKSKHVTRIYVNPPFKSELLNLTIKKFDLENIVVFDSKIFNDKNLKKNTNVIAEYDDFDMYLDDHSCHVVIEGVNDLGQLGTFIRTCLAFNYKNIVVVGEIDLFDKHFIRYTMGALFQVNVVKVNSFEEYKATYENRLYDYSNKPNSTIYFSNDGNDDLLFIYDCLIVLNEARDRR